MLIDLRGIGDELVIHFGGEDNKIDAEVFARSLLEFTLAIKAIDRRINVDADMEIYVEAIDGGSFRAWIRGNKSTLMKAGASVVIQQVFGSFASSLAEKLMFERDEINIVANDDHYIVENGNTKIILPKNNYEKRKAIKDDPEIQKRISKGLSVINENEYITSLGIADGRRAPTLFRADRQRIAIGAAFEDELIQDATKRYKDEDTELVVHKVIFERCNRKWEFIWRDGIKISAPVLSDDFFNKIDTHEIELGKGDKLNVTLRVHQERAEEGSVWVNKSYEVIEVYSHVSGVRQRRMNLNDPPT